MSYDQKAVAFGLITFCGCITCAVIGHYIEMWIAFFPLAIMFSMFSAIAVATGEK